MNLITTTELRTKTKNLVEALLEGKSVSLVHRSKIIGKVRPVVKKKKKFNAREFKKIIERLSLSYLTDEEIKKGYSEAMTKKHGKYFL